MSVVVYRRRRRRRRHGRAEADFRRVLRRKLTGIEGVLRNVVAPLVTVRLVRQVVARCIVRRLGKLTGIERVLRNVVAPLVTVRLNGECSWLRASLILL